VIQCEKSIQTKYENFGKYMIKYGKYKEYGKYGKYGKGGKYKNIKNINIFTRSFRYCGVAEWGPATEEPTIPQLIGLKRSPESFCGVA